jgi:predicted  nucleic acid-binding Zn-ribbon protein
MNATGKHPGLEMRLRSLSERIGELKRKMNRADSVTRIEMMGEVLQLEQREKVLEAQLRKLDGEGPGLRQNLKAEFDKIADDLAASVQDFIIRLDRHRAPD